MPGNSYLVMEFIDGVGLDRVIKGSGKMAVERAAAIGEQVADGARLRLAQARSSSTATSSPPTSWSSPATT